MSAYDTSTYIQSFAGLMHYGDGVDSDMRYAREAENVETQGGVLKPMAAPTLMDGTVASKIETLAMLHRRWYTGTDDSQDVLIAASGGQIYYQVVGGSVWTKINHPDGAGSAFADDVWSFVSYEINPTPGADPVDVLVMSNQSDGMIYVRCDDTSKAITAVTTPNNFGVIERYNERIWGGDIADDPDMVVYSAPYDFSDWDADLDIPEDGAGDIQQPTWDGDGFTAIRQFGNMLLAFRKNTVWRILGTDPGEWTWQQQHGGGTAYQNTICVDGERILMLGDHGLLQYDGYSVQPYYQEYCRTFWDSMNVDALEQACACMYKRRYYLAVPTDDAMTNNAVLIYDTVDKSWLLRTDLAVESWLATDSALYFTKVAEPGTMYTWNEDAWEHGTGAATCSWVSPWVELGRKDIRKGGWTVYLSVEGKAGGKLSISIETEKKKKTKSFGYAEVTDEGTAKQKRLSFGGSGRRWRLHIESTGTTVWRVMGGVQVISELDED